jgi:hypothetical protein
MRMSTKTLTSLLIVTAVAATVPGISQIPGRKNKQGSKFDRILQKHDRKGELRADVLGVDPLELRDMQKRMAFKDIIRRKGFKNERAFRLALFGKLKNELRQRGWSSRRIERYVAVRSSRILG